jgi:hypothetical protein
MQMGQCQIIMIGQLHIGVKLWLQVLVVQRWIGANPALRFDYYFGLCIHVYVVTKNCKK